MEMHTEGGGSPDMLLARIKNDRVEGNVATDIVFDKDDARMLFNWLGAWLHGATIS